MSELIWKALADPSRRRILDLLRPGPQTTGALATQFGFTRFALMKHLKLLEEASLITVERRGRERLNHLNAIPLQSVYRRWVEPLGRRSADLLLKLKSHTESDSVMPTLVTFQTLEVVHQVKISAPLERVWRGLTEETADWWPADFLGVGSSFRLDLKLGGHLFEDSGDGQGSIWWTIRGFRVNESLSLVGELDANYGGPCRELVEIRLSESSGGTRLRLHETLYGSISENSASSLEEGWTQILDKGLKPHCEA